MQKEHVARVIEQRGDVARAQHLPLPEANHERRRALGYDKAIGLIPRDNADRIGAFQLPKGLANSFE